VRKDVAGRELDPALALQAGLRIADGPNGSFRPIPAVRDVRGQPHVVAAATNNSGVKARRIISAFDTSNVAH